MLPPPALIDGGIIYPEPEDESEPSSPVKEETGSDPPRPDYRYTAIADSWVAQQAYEWAVTNYNTAQKDLRYLESLIPSYTMAYSNAQADFTKAQWEVLGEITWAVLTNLSVVLAIGGMVAAATATGGMSLAAVAMILQGAYLAAGDFDWVMSVISFSNVSSAISNANELKKIRNHHLEELNELNDKIRQAKENVEHYCQRKEGLLDGTISP